MKALLRKKLCSRRGETLTETLAALLIVGMASAVLATMVGAASRMNATAMEKDAALYAAVTAAEQAKEPVDGGGTVTVQVDGEDVSFAADYYADGAGTLWSYRIKEGSTP